MNNEALLQELAARIRLGELTRQEIAKCLDLSESGKPAHRGARFQPFGVEVLYAVGAVVVIAGIGIFVSNIWEDIGSLGRVSVTLGLGLMTAAIGSVLLRKERDKNLGVIFHLIGGALIPGGALVLLNEFDSNSGARWPVAISLGLVSGFYLLLTKVHKHPLLTFFAIMNGTASLYWVIAALARGSSYDDDDLYAYLTMVVGSSYLLLAQGRREIWHKALIASLCFLGSTAFLGAAFSRVFDSDLWKWLYFAVVLGGQLLSVYLKSRNVLLMSTLFLIVHIAYITNKYFADSLGWPISLVILGFTFIGLGYASVTINKKYIRDRA